MGQIGSIEASYHINEFGQAFWSGIAPPCQAHGYTGTVLDRPIDDTRPGMVVGRGHRRDPDAATRGDHIEPAIDIS